MGDCSSAATSARKYAPGMGRVFDWARGAAVEYIAADDILTLSPGEFSERYRGRAVERARWRDFNAMPGS